MSFIFILSRVKKPTSTFPLSLAKPLFTAANNFFSENHAAITLPNLKPFNSRISGYMRNGFVNEAQKLFDEMPHRNVVSWNAMLRGYFLNGYFENAIKLFNQMPERDVFSYNTLITGLMQQGNVDGASRVFSGMIFRDVVTWNSIVAGHIRNGMIGEAVQMFNVMPLKDVISWNLVIGGLVNCGELDLAEKYFKRMTIRDVASWTIMISGLVSMGRILEARELFDEMPVRDVQAWNALILGYIKSGYLEIAEALFHKMPERNLDSWKELVSGLLGNQRVKDAMKLFMEMPEKCQKSWNSIMLELVRIGLVREAHALLEKYPYSDVVSWTNIMVGYFQAGEVRGAVNLFELMPNRDATAYNATMFGLGENDRGEEGLKLYIRMKESGPSPDEATFTSILIICSNLPALHFGRQTHADIIKTGFCDVSVSNAMLTMYARCGNMDSALLEFSSMPSHDVISWNSMICGFAHHGNGEKALKMFEQMRSKNVKPNDITFVGVLSACSHAGLVNQGRVFFDVMKYEYFIQPTSEHYTCLVDLLGRFGLIDDAMTLIDQMIDDGNKVPASVWGALLGACRIHNKIEIAQIAGEIILDLEPWNSGVYLILAEMYQICGRRKDAERIWSKMKCRGVKKQPGCSWIEVNDSSHVFLSGDNSHPEFGRIYCVLDILSSEMETKKISKTNQ